MNPVIVIPRNFREEFRIQRQQFRNHDLVSLRVFQEVDNGEMRASDEGVAIGMSLLPDVTRALIHKLEEEKDITR